MRFNFTRGTTNGYLTQALNKINIYKIIILIFDSSKKILHIIANIQQRKINYHPSFKKIIITESS